jgi:MtrB/PioB family decaheme-associated outer membrane protein
MRVHNHFPLTILAATLLTAYAQLAPAAEGDENKQYTAPDSSVSVGVGYWTDPRLHEGMYDGMWDDGFYGSIDASIRKRDDATGTWTTLQAKNLGLDTVELGGSYEKQGDWGVGIDYSQTPRQNPVVVNTGLRGIGTQRQTITPVTPGGGTNYYMDVQRDATSLNMFKRFSPALEFRVNFKNEEKEGDRQYGVRSYPTFGGSGGSYPAFVAEPIDSTTRQLDALLNYNSGKLQLTGGYYGSWYNNHNNRLDVIGTAGGYTEMSLPPDNEAHQGYLKGNYAFTPTTRGMFKVAYTHATQNDPFMSVNNNGVGSWAPTATVGSSLQGEVNTLEAMVGLTARPMPQLSLLANLRYWDKQDDTPVRVDAQSSSGTTLYRNNPFEHTKTSGKLEGTYRLPDGYSVTAGVDYTHQERDISGLIEPSIELFVPYRNEVDETTYRINLRRSLSDRLNGSIGFDYSTRDGSDYTDVSLSVDSNTITPFYIADRDRSKLTLALDWTPIDPLGIQFSFSSSQDKYPEDGVRVDGVRKGTAQLLSVDANYALNDNWKLNAWYSHDTNKIDQVGPLNVAPGDWHANLDDKGDSLGLGVSGKATAKLNVGANVDWIRTNSQYEQIGSTTPLPDINNRITRLNLYGAYAVQKNASVRVDLIREVWKTDDWTWAFLDGSPYSYATEGTTVYNDLNQASTFVGVRYTYKFQ